MSTRRVESTQMSLSAARSVFVTRPRYTRQTSRRAIELAPIASAWFDELP
jgi:hypothetical protein